MKKFALLIVLLTIVAWIRPKPTAAQTQPAPEWVSWDLEVDFYKNAVHGQFTVILGYWDSNGEAVEMLPNTTLSVPCKPRGNVILGRSEATFNGGHVQCELPDLIDTANTIIAKRWPEVELFEIVPGECECVFTANKPIYADATGQLTGTSFAPVFHHPSIQFGLQPEGSKYVANQFTVDGQSSLSAWQKTGGTANFRSEYECYTDAGICKFRHFLDGWQTSANYAPLVTPILDTSATTIYIGYDPTTGAVFDGELSHVRVDPPCHINGYG